jgi:hypothetical protein
MHFNDILTVPASHFRQLAYLITVGDICSPFLATFDAEQTVEYVHDAWGVDICGEKGLDPMEQLALVQHDGKLKGFVTFDMLTYDTTVSSCMEPIEPDIIMSADTPLVDALEAFASTSHAVFFIVKKSQLIGWLGYTHFHRPPFRLCLFAMLMNVERLLLEALSLFPEESVQCLSKGRLEMAKKLYGLRKYDYNSEGAPYARNLLECTTIAGKIHWSRNETKTPTI